MRNQKARLTAAGTLLLTAHLASLATGAVRPIAFIGHPIPGKSDFLWSGGPRGVQEPTVHDINELGQVTFAAIPSSLMSLGIQGISQYIGDSQGFAEIACAGDFAPDGNTKYGYLVTRHLNNAGQVLFSADFLLPNGNYSGDSGYFRWDGGSIVQMVRKGDTAPDGNGYIANGLNFGTETSFDSQGRYTFGVELTGTSGGSADRYAILQSDGDNLIQVVRSGQIGPYGNPFAVVTKPASNEAGQVAFIANLPDITGSILFQKEGDTFTELVRYGQMSPRGDGILLKVLDFAFNNAGQAAFFTSDASDPNDGTTYRGGVFRADGDTLIEVARKGDPVPDGNGNFFGFRQSSSSSNLGIPNLNNTGQMTFFASLTGTTGGASDNVGLYRADLSGLTQIARHGQLSPDGNGTLALSNLSTSVMNDAGQVAFRASLTASSGETTDRGIFLWDDQSGLAQILRKGDSLFGSQITNLGVPKLNELGQLAFSFSLADGRKGVAIWTVPEPSTLALLCISATIAIQVCRKRRQPSIARFQSL